MKSPRCSENSSEPVSNVRCLLLVSSLLDCYSGNQVQCKSWSLHVSLMFSLLFLESFETDGTSLRGLVAQLLIHLRIHGQPICTYNHMR